MILLKILIFFQITRIFLVQESEPIQQALLERTPANLNNEAVLMHLAILKYSGDYVSRKPDFATEITDQIFLPPLKEHSAVLFYVLSQTFDSLIRA